MRVSYVARSFLDYRIPVFAALSRKLSGNFYVIYSADYIPERVNRKIVDVLGDHAIGMRGEKRVGPNDFADFANTSYRVVYQPGLIRQIAATKPDVLIGDGFFQWTSFALLYRLFKRTPLVVCYERTFHTERHAQWLRTAYRRLVVRHIDAMACNGILTVEYSKWLGMAENRITTGHMVADTEGLRAATEAVSTAERESFRKRWGDPELVFLSVGVLNERKGVKELLQAWSMLEKQFPEQCVLVVVGTGPLEQELKQLVRDLGLKGVSFEGSVDYNDIAKYYAASDVFIMPTLEDNWSLVVPEAMACSLPVACSKYNGCHPELVSPGENGWVFDPLDTADTYAVLRKFADSRHGLKAMGEASKKIVAGHSPDRAAESILDACRISLQKRT
jgi:glycosyltransferase involved in cell wall biosynthesis